MDLDWQTSRLSYSKRIVYFVLFLLWIIFLRVLNDNEIEKLERHAFGFDENEQTPDGVIMWVSFPAGRHKLSKEYVSY